MMRPFTILCMLLAAGSGLYLYQTKHRTLMLDRQIADVLKQADAARARTAVLSAQYAVLIQPDRLTELSGRYLLLKPTAQAQYVQLAALDAHLPPIEDFSAPPPLPQDLPGSIADADMDGASAAMLALSDAVPRQPDAPSEPASTSAPAADTRLLIEQAQAVHAGRHPLVVAGRQPSGGVTQVALHTSVAHAGSAEPQPSPQRVAASSRPPRLVRDRPANLDTATAVPSGSAAVQGQSMPSQSMLGQSGLAMAAPVPVAN